MGVGSSRAGDGGREVAQDTFSSALDRLVREFVEVEPGVVEDLQQHGEVNAGDDADIAAMYQSTSNVAGGGAVQVGQYQHPGPLIEGAGQALGLALQACGVCAVPVLGNGQDGGSQWAKAEGRGGGVE